MTSTFSTRSAAKWGEAAYAGFQPVPDALLIKQAELELSDTDLVVLLNLTSYWWFAEKLPFPRPSIIATRMGTSPRTIQRVLKRLEAKGYIRSDEQPGPDGATIAAISFSGLVEKLTELAQADPLLSTKIENFKETKGIPSGGTPHVAKETS